MLLIVASFPAHSRCPTWGAANSTSPELYSWVFLAPFCILFSYGVLKLKKERYPYHFVWLQKYQIAHHYGSSQGA